MEGLLKLFANGIGKRLKELRKLADINQDQMAEFQDVHRNTVSSWERQETDISLSQYLRYEELASKELAKEDAARIAPEKQQTENKKPV